MKHNRLSNRRVQRLTTYNSEFKEYRCTSCRIKVGSGYRDRGDFWYSDGNFTFNDNEYFKELFPKIVGPRYNDSRDWKSYINANTEYRDLVDDFIDWWESSEYPQLSRGQSENAQAFAFMDAVDGIADIMGVHVMGRYLEDQNYHHAALGAFKAAAELIRKSFQ